MKTKRKLKPMTPHEARGFEEICSLQSDNYGGSEGWIMIDGNQVVLCQQRPGENSTGTVHLSRGAFMRMVNWYLRPQERVVRL